jgi:hypothetical protein
MTSKADPDDDNKFVNFQDPSFILKNIVYEDSFEVHSSFSIPARSNLIECMCDQICFYVMCAYRAHHLAALTSAFSLEEKLKIKPPGILVYGSGVVAECVLEALADMGCAPFIKVFSRDVASAKEWARKGYRSTVEMRTGYEIDILLICSNLCSFSQLCRDLSQFLTPKTFIISNVFCLQRKRMYNLFGTPGIVRTYVERKGASKHARLRDMSTRAFSARQLASKVNGVKNLILVLENYMIALDIHKDTARREAMHLVVGADRISLEEERMNSPYKNKTRFSFSDDEGASFGVFESNDDSDSESDSNQPSVNSTKITDNKADDDLISPRLTEAEEREALFLIRQRSFAIDDSGVQEAEKALERKNKRRQRRLRKQLLKNKQKLNKDVYEQLHAGDGDSDDDDDGSDDDDDAGAATNTNVLLHLPSTAEAEDPLTIITEEEEGDTPLPPPASTPPSPFHKGRTPPSSLTLNAFKQTSRRASAMPAFLAVEESSSPSGSSVMQGFSPKVGSKSKKKSAISATRQSEQGGSGSPYLNLRRTQSSPDHTKREREEREEQEKMDKIFGITSNNKSGAGFLHQISSALSAEPNIDKLINNSPLLEIIRNIEKRYGEIFRQELSKHILIMDLPSLVHVEQKAPSRRRKHSLVSNILSQRASLARKRTQLLSVIPTVTKKHDVGYLDSKTLLAIFNSDKKTANLAGERSPLLEQMDEESDEEDKEGEGDVLFIEDAPRDKFRFFVLDLDSENDDSKRSAQLGGN